MVMKAYLEAGQFVTTHGVLGELKLYPWADGPEFIACLPRLYISPQGGAPLELERVRAHKGMCIVKLRGVDGMDAAREIRPFDDAADIVFLTSSPGFAYESYGVRALEYLLKPINAKLLYPVLDKLYLRDQKPQDGLTVKSNGMLVRLPFSHLSYVEVNGKHLFFNMADGTVHEVAASMREYEGALLARPEFMRVHRSYIVNMLQAEKLSPAGVITFSGHNVPVSRLLYGQLQKDYLALLFSGRDA